MWKANSTTKTFQLVGSKNCTSVVSTANWRILMSKIERNYCNSTSVSDRTNSKRSPSPSNRGMLQVPRPSGFMKASEWERPAPGCGQYWVKAWQSLKQDYWLFIDVIDIYCIPITQSEGAKRNHTLGPVLAVNHQFSHCIFCSLAWARLKEAMLVSGSVESARICTRTFYTSVSFPA